MILPDHPTPLALKTHTNDPVPYMIYHKQGEAEGVDVLSEESAEATGRYEPIGHELMGRFLKN